MSNVLDRLVSLLSLEKIEENLFRGQSQDLGWGTVYGGQVIGQALSAALNTVPADRTAHSLHAYFLRPGDVSAPIVYDVERTRDGSSFTTRHVKAIQHGQPIFDMSASFQKSEPGFDHQAQMPNVPAPEDVPTEQERMKPYVKNFPEFMQERILAPQPIEIRTIGEPDPSLKGEHPPLRQVWFKTTHKVADTPVLHQALLAYASDFSFITTALKPHGKTWISRGMQVASIDHAVWFHAPFRADEWLLHVMDSPRASGARGLVRGQIFSRDGKLVASTNQEGLIRHRPDKA
ncbi:MAG: acyl-CoA thioesterase II [Archangium sp.]